MLELCHRSEHKFVVTCDTADNLYSHNNADNLLCFIVKYLLYCVLFMWLFLQRTNINSINIWHGAGRTEVKGIQTAAEIYSKQTPIANAATHKRNSNPRDEWQLLWLYPDCRLPQSANRVCTRCSEVTAQQKNLHSNLAHKRNLVDLWRLQRLANFLTNAFLKLLEISSAKADCKVCVFLINATKRYWKYNAYTCMYNSTNSHRHSFLSYLPPVLNQICQKLCP